LVKEARCFFWSFLTTFEAYIFEAAGVVDKKLARAQNQTTKSSKAGLNP